MPWIPSLEVQFRIQSLILTLLQQITLQQDCIFHFCSTDKQRSLQHSSSTKLFVQTIIVLDRIHELLIKNKHITQRDLYYWCVDYFSSQMECNQIIQDVTHILSCPRECLHIFTSSRGMICGNIVLHSKDARTLIMAIPCTSITSIQHTIPLAKYIIIIEKDGIFQRLFEDKFHQLIPSILITACGYPDYATRNMIQQLYKILQIPVLCLVDYNPHGMDIFLTYKVTISETQWLGIHSKDVQQLQLQSIPFTQHDEQYCNTLEQKIEYFPTLKNELLKMKQLHCKVELEALHLISYSFLKEFVKNKILQRDYLQ